MSQSSNVGITVERNTICLQAIAALLIANSHLKGFYPHNWMAADGFTGNSLFFLLSGYGITTSLRHKEQKFAPYYGRRILRIYPVLWIVMLAFKYLLEGNWNTATFRDYWWTLVYPTPYTYITLVMVYYVLFYLIKRWLAPAFLMRLLAILFAPLLYFWGMDFSNADAEHLMLGNTAAPVWCTFWFQVMLLGGYLALRPAESRHVPAGPAFARCFAIFTVYVLIKFFMDFGIKVPLTSQSSGRFYILLHLLMLPLMYYAFISGTSESLLSWLKNNRLVHWFIALAGGLTLEIYTVHGFVHTNDFVRKLTFPLNVAVFFIATLLLATVVSLAARYWRKAIEAGFLRMASRKKADTT